MKPHILVSVVSAVVLTGGPAAMNAGPGDRFPAVDVDLRYPKDCFMHNGQGGHVIDVTNIPNHISDHDAYPDGTHADETTDALIDICDWLLHQFKTVGSVSWHGHTTAYIVYFPNGTYLVNDTIVHRGPPWLRQNGHENLNRLRFYGQSRSGVTIRLVDGAPGFADGTSPKAVIAFTKHTRNNSVSTNILQNLTVDVGKGNPGAVGIDFQGANLATVRNVTIRSGDGQGHAGLRLPIWPTQGFYSDITVMGFDYGVDVVGGMVANGPAFENITLRGQKKCGFRLQTSITPIRNLYVEDPQGPAVTLTTNKGHLLLLDSTLAGGPDDCAAVEAPADCRSLYARNVQLPSGFGNHCIKVGADIVHTGNLEGEYVAGERKALFPNQRTASLNLPIEESPIVPYDPPSKWISVESHGAIAGDSRDDTAALQAALNACDGRNKTTVYFRTRGEYDVSGSVSVPAGVKRITFLWGARITTGDLAPPSSSVFKITEACEDPIVFEDYFQHIRGNPGFFIEHASTRTVICRNLRPSRDFSNYRHTSGDPRTKLFLENVAHVLSEGCLFDNTCWARWINTETAREVEFLNSGGRLWVLGFKCEDSAINFRSTNGGATEVLGGIINQYRSRDGRLQSNPAFELIDARGSFIGSTSGPTDREFRTIVTETRGDVTRVLQKSDFPVREDNKVHIPLFAGYEGR